MSIRSALGSVLQLHPVCRRSEDFQLRYAAISDHLPTPTDIFQHKGEEDADGQGEEAGRAKGGVMRQLSPPLRDNYDGLLFVSLLPCTLLYSYMLSDLAKHVPIIIQVSKS